MSYNSRLYVVDVHREKEKGSTRKGRVLCTELIATFELSCMGQNNGWQELFDQPIDYEIKVSPELRTDKDGCGEILRTGDYDKIIRWLEVWNKKEYYRRIGPVLGMLKGFRREEWDDLQIVHCRL